jgi:ParB family chromosome partitioning protein
MPEKFTFEDPHKNQQLTLRVVGADDLEVIGHQRKPRPAHVKNVTGSIDRIGFVVPLVVVERKQDGQVRYVIIDGQHRFEAAKGLGIKEFPVIVAPEELARRMMNLNVEKDLNIREKSFISISLYRDVMEETPDLAEDDAELVDAIEQAHYITLGLAYEKSGRIAGSSYEPILKKSDSFLDDPVSAAYEIRQQRAQLVIDADKLVKSISKKLKEKGTWHSFVTQQILSYANPLKRTRKAVEFDDAFKKLIKKLEDLDENPEKVLREKVE